MLRSTILSVAIIATTTSFTFAADAIPVDKTDPVPVDAARFGWTGLYLGGYVGAGAMVSNIEVPPFGPGNFNGIGGEGYVGGFMAGYNYQLSEKFVVGVQADVGWADLKSELNVPGFLTASVGPDLVYSISARAGWLPSANTMLYILAGYSHAELEANISIGGFSGSVQQDYKGYHVGTGLETRLSSNLTARVEYRYTQYGGEDWGTGGFLNIEPSTHVGTFGLAWNWFDSTYGATIASATPKRSSWTGLYVGGNVGGGAMVSNIEVPLLLGLGFNGIGGEGFVGGVTVGYDYQISDNFVVGIQGDYGVANLETELNIPGFLTASVGPNHVYSFSARAGWLASPDTLLYVIGGYSRAELEASVSIGGFSGSVQQDYKGYHVGGGLETMLTENLSARVEYRFTEYESEDWGTGGFLNIEPSSHVGTIGLSWKF